MSFAIWSVEVPFAQRATCGPVALRSGLVPSVLQPTRNTVFNPVPFSYSNQTYKSVATGIPLEPSALVPPVAMEWITLVPLRIERIPRKAPALLANAIKPGVL